MQRVLIIIQARTGSTRLPGKVLMELLPGKSLLACLLQRLQQSSAATEIIVATSELPNDDPIVAISKAAGVRSYRGSETDVLSRFVEAAKLVPAETIVRLCADSPLHDAQVVDRCIGEFLRENNEVDYMSNMQPESYPYGMAVEVFAKDVLERLDRLTKGTDHREHVTSFIRARPDLFLTNNITHSTDLSHYRFSVDFPEDFEFVKQVYKLLTPKQGIFSWQTIVQLVEEQPWLAEINARHNGRTARN